MGDNVEEPSKKTKTVVRKRVVKKMVSKAEAERIRKEKAKKEAIETHGGPRQAAAPKKKEPEKKKGSLFGTMTKILFLLMIVQFGVSGYLKSGKTAHTQAKVQISKDGLVLNPFALIWEPHTHFDVYGKLSQDENPTFRSESDDWTFVERDLEFFPDKANHRIREITVEFPNNVIEKNSSLYLDVIFVRHLENPLERDESDSMVHRYAMTEFRPAPHLDERKNLLSGESRVSEEEIEKIKSLDGKYVPFFCPNLVLQLVLDPSRYKVIPEDLRPGYENNINPEDGSLRPIVFKNSFWQMSSWCMPINDTTPSFDLSVHVETTSLWKYRLYYNIQKSLTMQASFGQSASSDELDEMKRMLLETNPYLLVLTTIVTIAHTALEFLAFKNDIKFWKNNSTLEGLSVRTLFMNAVTSLIIFLYLLDNETSWMIIMSAGFGTVIEFWKITKGMNVSIDTSGSFPRLRIQDKDTYVKSKTKEYDEQAMRYLSYALYPLMLGYAIYSLYTDSHKSWYSWLLSSSTGFVYAFGFIRMCPQLFINYKLKSVAAMPWRAFTYKTLGTFIDDLFAFIIKMPLLHRIACFRDDVVFFVYLYQKWIYPVDKKRPNEFGQIVDPVAAAEARKRMEQEGGVALADEKKQN